MSEAKNFEAWMKQEYSHNQLADIANHGCAGGFTGLCYYSETTELYKRYDESIWLLLQEYADDVGYKSVIDMLAKGNDSDTCVDSVTFKNHLVWIAAELIAFRLTQGEYVPEEDETQEGKRTFLDDLNQFSGAVAFYKNLLNPHFVYTEGVQYVAEEGNAYWLINLIALELLPKALKRSKDYFYSVKLTVTKDQKALILLDDGSGGKPIIEKVIEYSDFPSVQQFTLFLIETTIEDKTVFCLMLPSEY